jgi:hypothetical protein
MHWLFVLLIICWIIGAIISAANAAEKPKPPTVNIILPPVPPRPARPFMPGGEANSWYQYAMRNPAVKLQVVEKLEVSNGQFVAEKHMKMTGPVRGPIDPMDPRNRICIFPGSPPKKKWWDS